MARFVKLKKLSVESAACEMGTTYDDSVLKIDYVPIRRQVPINHHNESGQILNSSTYIYFDRRCNNNIEADEAVLPEDFSNDNDDYYAHEGDTLLRSSSPSHKWQQTLEKSDESSVMAYICKFKPRKGALSLEKCVDRGVTPGPILGKLKNGEDVILPNGETVYAVDVCEPDDPGPVLIGK